MFGGRRHIRGRRGGGGMGMLFLGMQLFSFFNFLSRSDRFFPATLAIMALNIVTHLKPSGLRIPWPSPKQACISVQGVWFGGEWKRVLYSPFVHGGDYHLFYNMASFMWKAVTLERHFGTFYFTYMVAVFSIATGLLYLAIHYLLAELLDQWSSIQSCAVGFSGVIFALKVVTTHLQPSGMTMVMGIPVPTRLACWAELVVISVLFPNVSFVGHLSGILVGLAFVSGPLKTIMDIPLASVDTGHWNTGGSGPNIPRGGSYTYRAAPTGYRGGAGEERSGGRMPSNRNAHSSEEEDLQEAIRRSLRDEGTRPHHAPQDDRHHTSSESRDLQMAINRSLQQLDMPPSRDHDPPLHETPPPPYNPSYHPQTAQGVPESTHIPPQEEPPTGEEEGGVRRRRVPGGVAAGSEVELDAVRAARLRRFETTN